MQTVKNTFQKVENFGVGFLFFSFNLFFSLTEKWEEREREEMNIFIQRAEKYCKKMLIFFEVPHFIHIVQ